MKTRIGYFASIEQYKPMDALKQAVRAENVGFDSIWVDDHFHPWCHTDAQSGFAWSWMGSALQATKHVFISTCITCPTIRYNPAIVAQAFDTMAQMYPGRVGLAVGAGEPLNEIPVTGKWPSIPERQEMTIEALQVIKKLWDSKTPVTFNGKYYTLNKAFMYTKPEEKVPVYFSGIGPKGARIAGIHGDHLMTAGMPPELLKSVTIPSFEAGAKEAGKDPKKMERAMLIWYSVDTDYEKAVNNLRFWSGCLVPATIKYPMCESQEIEAHGKMVHTDIIKQTFMPATNAEDMIKHIKRFKDAGITTFCLGNSSPNVNHGIDVFKDVIPAVTE
jgi:G6PDH family F420-dependent oxidoreductase